MVYILENFYVEALPLGLEEKGVYIAIVAAESLMSVVTVHIFMHGRWKIREVCTLLAIFFSV